MNELGALVGIWILGALATFVHLMSAHIQFCKNLTDCIITVATDIVYSAVWPGYWAIQMMG